MKGQPKYNQMGDCCGKLMLERAPGRANEAA